MLLSRKRWNLAVLQSNLMKFPSMQSKGFSRRDMIHGYVTKKQKRIVMDGQERIRALNTTSVRRAFVLASTISGGSCFAYALSLSHQNIFSTSIRGKTEEDAVLPAEPKDGFRHPYDGKPLWWRLLLISKRIIILGRCFAPFFVLTIITLFTDSKEWR
jgi:hypothetical protein